MHVINTFLIAKFHPFFNVCNILAFGGAPPCTKDNFDCSFWKVAVFESFPDRQQAISLMSCNRCVSSLTGWTRVFCDLGKIRGIWVSILPNLGNQVWVVQYGTTTNTDSTLSLIILCNILLIIEKGGNIKQSSSDQSSVNASIFIAKGSGFHDTYSGNWLLRWEANRPIFGFPKQIA